MNAQRLHENIVHVAYILLMRRVERTRLFLKTV